MKGLDVAARQFAKLASWAIDESLAKLFPPPKAMTSRQFLTYLDRIETDKEVLDPGDCDCVLGSPTPWAHEDHLNPSTGAAGRTPPEAVVDGAGGRLADELTWVLTVILRRHLSKNLGLAGAIAPVVAKSAAAELLAHFDVERKA